MRVAMTDINRVIRVLGAPEVISGIGDCQHDLWFVASKLLLDRELFVLMPDQESVFIFRPMNQVAYEVHVAITRQGRRRSVSAGREAFLWMVDNTPCKKILAFSGRREVALYARRAGMVVEGRSAGGDIVNGEMADLVHLGATEQMLREVMKCHQQ